MDRNSQLQNLGEQLERMKLFNAGVSLTGVNYQIRALEESNAALTSRLMLVEGTVKTQERLLRDVINHLRNTSGDTTIMQDNEYTLKMRALQGEVTMREQMVAQLQNEAAKQQATMGQLLASMGEQTEEATRTNDNQNFKSYSTIFFVPNVSNKKEVITSESDNKENKESDNKENKESDNKENKDTTDTDREETYTEVIYDELDSRPSFTAFPNEEASMDDSSSGGNDSVGDSSSGRNDSMGDSGSERNDSVGDSSSGRNDSVGDSGSEKTFSVENEVKRRESFISGETMPLTPRSGQKTRRSLNEKPIWRQ